MDALVVESSLDDLENVLEKLCGDFVNGECHIVDINDSDFGASW